ncbi:MAG: nucleotide exchange factor GrpE [Candidatus Omnitrophica bacterium]|nr:nucleotide exchange factor GrpE [Candidatus Omnitrophota bacterium]MDE2010183.1 nucleotide exchange factor GrpE [Candidatus Omnitrophota bacterium]MDE2215072.1 nucleotide exchange factor GrpE [Candidatus Omnitrophota bacterium]MDE2232211.1 nucleotide exchange factor GrpE [Candidatus Omnitrophota bacterium]
MDQKNSKPEEEILSQQAAQEELQEEGEPKEAKPAAPADEDMAYKDKYVRLLAEFDNMRKRHERERMQLIKYAHEEVIIECLKLYDDLERSLLAFKSKAEVDANLVRGLEMVYNRMKELMGKYEVRPIVAVGKPFDPNAQEILMQQETAEFPDGTVMEELEKGYTLGGRVVRTAKVKVAKNIN